MDIARNYDNQMIFIAQMREKLDNINYKLERTNLFFFQRPALEKEAKAYAKILALAMIKLNEIIEPVQLTEINNLLKVKP